jgi:RNA polymerase primary sigma factor
MGPDGGDAGRREAKELLASLLPDDPSLPYLQKVLRMPPLTPAEAEAAARNSTQDTPAGAAARQKLVEGHLALVAAIAGRYSQRGLALMDLIQEGNQALLAAASAYGPDSGSLAAFASPQIVSRLEEAIAAQATSDGIPVYLADSLNQAMELARVLAEQLGRMPTEEEIAEAMHIKQEQLADIMRLLGEPALIGEPEAGEQDDLDDQDELLN